MPYNKTEVRNKLREIINQLYTMDEHGEIQVENFSEFTESLENLWVESSKLYQKGQDGKYPALDVDKYGKLFASYGQALDKANAVLGQTEGNQALNDLTQNLTRILYVDVAALENIVPGKDITLPEVIEKGRSVTVDLGNAKLAGSGNALSSRIPIQYRAPDGTERKGFFTQKYTVPGRKEVNEVMKPIEDKYPQYKALFDTFREVDDKKFFAFNWTPLHVLMPFVENSKKPQEALFEVFFDGMQMSPELKTEICSKPDYYQFMNDLTSAVSPVALANMTYCENKKWLGGQEGERIDNRNSAMSMVSKLLGLPDLIAPAEPMTIIVDGKEIQGTFMENAYGKEVFGLKPDDPMHQYTVKNFDNPAVFSQVADMQVVDYICGNIDRHEGNFFMQFEGEGTDAKLTKLTLIDNDLSFGKNLDGSRQGNMFVLPSQMGIIDKDTSLKVMALTKATLSVGLKGYDLSDEQIDYAWQRTQALQNQISISMEKYKDVPEGTLLTDTPRIVAKENMDKYSLMSISKASFNSQFNVFNEMQKKIRDHTASSVMNKENIAQFNKKYNIVEAPEKPKAVRLQGELSKNSIFVNPDEEVSFKPIETIDVEIAKEAQLDSVGGAMSSRKPISYIDNNGNEQKGFFTSRSVLNEETQVDFLFKETMIAYPEFKDYLQELRKYYDKTGSLMNRINMGFPGYSLSDVQTLMEDPRFREMAEGLDKSVKKASSNIDGYLNGYGACANSSVDLRNVAMSNMAELMGNPSLLASSKPMRMKQGNHIVEGVFMELAHGVDYSNIYDGDPETEYTEDVYNYGPGLKSISDLQVLDFICMNVDRHQGNMMYQFEKIDGQVKLTGVQGIDNDLSFFARRAKDDEAIDNAGALDDIKFISENQAKFIQSARPEDVEAALGSTKLTAPEISATMDRIYRLKDRINSNKIQVLSDNDWNNKTLSELSVGNNTFAMIKNNMIGEGLQKIAKARGKRADKKPLEFTVAEKKEFSNELVQQSAELVDEDIERDFQARNNRELTLAEKIIKERFELKDAVEAEHQRNLQVKDPFDRENFIQLQGELKELNSAYNKSNHFFGGSDEYTKAVNEFKDLRNLLNSTPERINDANEYDEMQFMEEINEQLQYVKMAASALDAKTKDSSSSNQRDRNAFAKSLNSFANNLTERFSNYKLAKLEKQEELIEQRRMNKAKPLQNYIVENKYDQRFDFKKAEGFAQMKIASGLRNMVASIEHENPCTESVMVDLVTGFILKDTLAETKAKGGEESLRQYDGQIKTIFSDMQKNEYIKSLAKAVVKDPEYFADMIVSGRMGEVYKDFKRVTAMQDKTANIDLEKKQESKVISGSEEPSLGGGAPGL